MAIVVGAQAADEYTLGYPDETVNSCNGTFSGNTATFSVDGKSFTMTRPETDKSISTGNATGGGVKRYGVKFSQNVAYTITLPNGVSVNQIKVGGWANKSDATTSYVRYINDTDVSAESGNSFTGQGTYTEWSYTLPSAVSGSFTITFKGAETVANLTLICGESAPATQPVITTQPQNVTNIIGSEDSPSFTVAATASAGNLSYQWRVIDGTKDNAVQGAMDATIVMKDYIPADLLTVPGTYQVYCVVTDGNGSVESNKANLIIKNSGTLVSVSASTTWSFSDITWDGTNNEDPNKAGDFAFVGDDATKEWIYSDIAGLTFASTFNADGLAFTGKYPIRNNSKKYAQEGTIHFNTTVPGTIKVDFSDTGKTIPEGGAVKRYLNVNGVNSEFYTMRDGNGTDPKTAEVEVVAGDVTIAGMGEDGETPQSICITNIVFTAKEVATGPTITKQPAPATYIIGTTDYPSTSIEATASAGELKYQWHIILGNDDITIPGATSETLSTADYISVLSPYMTQPANYDMYCVVTDDNGSVTSQRATLIVKEEEVGPELDEQTDVIGDMTWDWSKFGTTEIKFLDDGTTTPKKPSTPPTADEEFVLSNVIAYGWCESIGADFGDAQALKVACEYPVRDGKYFQGPILRFNTTLPGTVTVTCSSTGSKSNHDRDVIIGGNIAGEVTNTTMADFTSEVAAGEVLIKGVQHGDGADADAQYLRISKIVFTANATTVDAIAEANAAEVAPVKVIKNGKLFIGNVNIAGQRVK